MRSSPAHILITGASSGIGAALAKTYAAPGIFLALGGRHENRLHEIAQACRDKGAVVDEKLIDVTERDKMKRWITALDKKRPLDLVIANAGISGGTGGEDGGESEAQVRQIFDINFNGMINTIWPVLPLMMARKKGQVVLMSSLASFSGWPGAPAYSASKGAVRLYGEALRGTMAAHGVKINVICPGFIKTPMTDANNFFMPFMIDSERCAGKIKRALRKNKGRIAFPWQTYFLAGFFGILPHWLSLKIFTKLPEKPVTGS